nr:odorant receptor 67a [Spodoptera frugiperda]
MRVLSYVWKSISQSKALELAGPLETAFFASVYRLSFFVGLSMSDDYLLYTLYSSFIRIICSLVVWFEIWHVLGNTDVSLDQIISSVNVIFIHLVTIWKLVTMVKNKSIFKRLAKALESSSFDMSSPRIQCVINNWILISNQYFKMLLRLGLLTLTVWESYPMIDEIKFNLMVDVKLPFEYQSLLTYIVTYIAVAIMFAYASLMVIISELIMQAHLIRLICQFDVLADCFENIFEECAEEFPDLTKHELVKDKTFVDKYVKRLGDLVAQHREILDQTNDLRTILSAPLLGQLTCSGLLICFVGYQATATIAENLGKFVMSLLYLGYNMFTWYLMCRWCEEITIKSQRIGEAAYFSGWESGISLAPGARATITLVIARANKPLVFVAGGMYTLSLSSYTTLVKASYSALNILLTMSHE